MDKFLSQGRMVEGTGLRAEFRLPLLYPILNASLLPLDLAMREDLLRWLVAELMAAGVTLLQYRNKSGKDGEIVRDCAMLREGVPGGAGMAGAQRCRLILDDRADLVSEVDFDGVHVGQEDMLPEEARALVGGGGIVGVSTHNDEQLRRAELSGADYVAIGPVFQTSSKERPDPVVGLDGVRRARALTSKPLVAIGGITVANCGSVRAAGADSVAVISSLFGGSPQQSIAKTARDFLVNLR